MACASQAIFADEPQKPAEEAVQVDPAMIEEIKFIKALVDGGYSDLAEGVIATTKKKWPESEAELFAIEIRGLLLLAKFDEAEKKIAALPDRKSAKFWAARVELGSFYFLKGRKDDGKKVYDEFFGLYKDKTPPKELMNTYINAAFTWGQLLVKDRRFSEAIDVYAVLLSQKLDKIQRGGVLCEASDISLRLAGDMEDANKRKPILDRAEPWIKELQDDPDQPIYFGRSINMMAHLTMLRGDYARAQGVIEDFFPQLFELHQAIKASDPDGKNGSLRLSPIPQCRYLLAKMQWIQAQEEFAKGSKKDDEAIKTLMFGAIDGKTGKRNGRGAYNHAINVFLRYPESSWSPAAGELADEIKAFAKEKYGANVTDNITPDMIAKIRANQFKGAANKQLEGEYIEAIDGYIEVLGRYPEEMESIPAVEAVATCYLDLMVKAMIDKNKNLEAEYRECASAVEGYLVERFCENDDKKLMTLAGDAVLRLANKEKERQQLNNEIKLKRMFAENFLSHPNAPGTAAGLANELMKGEKFKEAIEIWTIITEKYEGSQFYASAFAQISQCYVKLGERQKATESLLKYVEVEKDALLQTQAQMQLAQMYKDDGVAMLKQAEEKEGTEEGTKLLTQASASIIRGIKQFTELSTKAEGMINTVSTPTGEKEKYSELREAGMFLIGDSWSRMVKPVEKLDSFRQRSADSFEAYVKAYPKGKYTKAAYVKLGTVYTALQKSEEAKGALERLGKDFPDSDEAKNAKPRLAKSLVEMGMAKEGAEIYAEMLRTDGAYTSPQFVAAGEALIEARSWDLANQAFDKAIAKATPEQISSVAKAKIGKAKSLYRQKAYVEARDSLDSFLADSKMSKLAIAEEAYQLIIDVASEQGSAEKNDELRAKDFGAAIGAVKKLRVYWAKKEQWELDSLDLKSADVQIRRMKAEEAMDLKEQALETCGKAAASLQSFLQARQITKDRPFEALSAGDKQNLEDCYTKIVPLFSKLGAGQTDRVLKFGQQYLDLFPNGKARTEIINCMNQAKALSAAPAEQSQNQEEK